MNGTKKINIAFATDDNYVMSTTVAMTSLFENNHDETIVIHLLSIQGHLCDKSKNSLQGVVDKYQRTIIFTDVPQQLFEGLPVLRHGLSSYLRLFTPSLYPNIDQLLYLDADIVVDGSITELYNYNIDNYQVAGVADQMTLNLEHLEKIGYQHNRAYINTGVLLMNLKALRKIDIKSCINEYLSKYHDALHYGDQDIINNILPNILIIPPKYNAIPLLWNTKKRKRERLWSCDDIAEAQRNPAIIHYITPVKPWHLKCRHLYKARWYHYLAMTEFKDFRPKITVYEVPTIIKNATIGVIKNLTKRVVLGLPLKQ